MSESHIEEIQNHLLDWFAIKGRHWIPWKLNQSGYKPQPYEYLDPYKIWVAEVMLQQTQLKVVIPYWEKWMNRFPNLTVLATADNQEVLLYWQGLGYYSRANRIYAAAKLLIRKIGSEKVEEPHSWPRNIEDWIELPGIGRSTAGSILSSAFNLPYPILDGNVKRVLARLIASNKPPNQVEKQLWKLSFDLLSKDSARSFNQSLMDLGATVCTHQKPNCIICPLRDQCIAFSQYDPINFPIKKMKQVNAHNIIGLGIVFNKDRRVLIGQRKVTASMGGMWEFPGGKQEKNEEIKITIQREIKEEIGITVKAGFKLLSFDHAYSHKKLHFIVHICEWIGGIPQPLGCQQLLWVRPEKLSDYPFPAANIRIISELYKYLGIKP